MAAFIRGTGLKCWNCRQTSISRLVGWLLEWVERWKYAVWIQNYSREIIMFQILHTTNIFYIYFSSISYKEKTNEIYWKLCCKKKSMNVLILSFPNNCIESIKIYWYRWLFTQSAINRWHTPSVVNFTMFSRLLNSMLVIFPAWFEEVIKIWNVLDWDENFQSFHFFIILFPFLKDIKGNLLHYTDYYYIRKFPLSL